MQSQAIVLQSGRPCVTPQIKETKTKSNQISTKLSRIVLLIGTIFLFLIIILNIVIEHPLFLMGLNFIYKYQQNQPHNWIKVIQNILSILASQVIGIIIVIYIVLVKRKLVVLIHIGYFSLFTYLIGILNLALQSPRPYWYDSRIENWDRLCPMTFGNPSGHAYAMIMLYQPIFSDVLGYGKFHFVAPILITFWVTSALSRMYLGSHSSNQVLFGVGIGLIQLVLYKYVFQKMLYQVCWSFLTKSFRKNKKQIIKLVGLVLINAFSFVIPIIFYSYNSDYKPVKQKYLQALNKSCEANKSGEQLQAQLFREDAIAGLLFGFIYGFVFLRNKRTYQNYFTGKWKHVRKWKYILTILAYVIFALVPFQGLHSIGQYALKDKALPRYIIYYIAALCQGFGVSYFVPLVSFKFNIIKEFDKDKVKLQAKPNTIPNN